MCHTRGFRGQFLFESGWSEVIIVKLTDVITCQNMTAPLEIIQYTKRPHYVVPKMKHISY